MKNSHGVRNAPAGFPGCRFRMVLDNAVSFQRCTQTTVRISSTVSIRYAAVSNALRSNWSVPGRSTKD